MRLVVFTIGSNDQVSQAAALFHSVERHLPTAKRALLLADEPHPAVAYPKDCALVPARGLGVSGFAEFAFRYRPHEFRAALKPFGFQHLLGPGGFSHALFLGIGSDIDGPLPSVMTALSEHASFVLKPRRLRPAEDPGGVDDLAGLRSGVFHDGFLAASATEETRRLLGWWSRWVRTHCYDDKATGIYLDGKFLDLLPGLAPSAHIMRDPAPGFTLNEAGPPLAEAVEPSCPYAFSRFRSGTAIPDLARQMLRADYPGWQGDPFETFEDYTHLPAYGAEPGTRSAPPSLAMLWLRARMPKLAALDLTDPDDVDRLNLWWQREGPRHGVPARFVARQVLASGKRPGALRTAPDGAVTLLSSGEGHYQLAHKALRRTLATADARSPAVAVVCAPPADVPGLLDSIEPDTLCILVPLTPPDAFSAGTLGRLDEVWAPTRALAAAYVPATSCPVLHVPLDWRLPETAGGDAIAVAGDLRLAEQVLRACGEDTRRLVAPGEPAACLLALDGADLLGLPLLRCLQAAIPVIAVDCGGHGEFVTWETGYPVATNTLGGPDLGQAAWGLQQVLRRPEEARCRAMQAAAAVSAALDPAAISAMQTERLAARLAPHAHTTTREAFDA